MVERRLNSLSTRVEQVEEAISTTVKTIGALIRAHFEESNGRVHRIYHHRLYGLAPDCNRTGPCEWKICQLLCTDPNDVQCCVRPAVSGIPPFRSTDLQAMYDAVHAQKTALKQ